MQSPRIARLLLDPAGAGELLAGGAPLIEPWDDTSMLVTFLWQGEAQRVRAGWGVDVPMARIPGTSLWAGSAVFPADLRTTYCFERDGVPASPRSPGQDGPAVIDPRNPEVLHFPADPADPDDYDTFVSVLSLPKAPDEPWLFPPEQPGSIHLTTLDSAALGLRKQVAVHLPYGVDARDLPVLVVFDGFLARHVLRLPDLLDNLVAAGRIPPHLTLLVSNFDATRDDELTPTPPIARFVAGELLPWAGATFGAGRDGRRNIVAGCSRGGLAATYVALRHPSAFGAVIAQSGSFWWPSPAEGEPGRLIREVVQRPPVDVRFYLDVGVRETMPGPGGAPTQLFVNRAMRDALRDTGHAVTYAEYSGGHDYLNWRRTFADAMQAVTGVPSGAAGAHAAQEGVAGAGPAPRPSRR